ncbi:protein pigeon isoform X2 [Plutella xylostella]|uniref:protein pigeon isoform X2 n=1 Tax=Plutella xylostella TaxID=51655 RepID=UPI002032E319|nr:protein pigeon isoform X2 [Plutella xylostella]
MAIQNIAVKLCGILQSESDEEVTAREWRLIGQEQDGSQLLTWVTSTHNNQELLNIGVYTNKTKTLSKLHRFNEKLNIIQASVNASHSLLVYVVKEIPKEDEVSKEALYYPYLLPLLLDKENKPIQVQDASSKQVMVQYVYGKSHKYSPGVRNDRFLLFKHLECINIYRTTMICNDCDDGTEEWGFDGVIPEPDTIVRVFSWAQWDCVNQVLYYIHYRQPTQSFAEGEEVKSPSEIMPTLSALQFHADLPHETVLNIPLSLPQLGSGGACGEYQDDPAPLRVHDCSLDLQVAGDASGVLCICHHYLYKPLDDSTTSLEDGGDLKESGVNFAYSITILHHGCVAHSVVPDLPWALAKSLRPSYTLYGDTYLLVNIPNLFTHLLDVSLSHEPCCHIVLPTEDCVTSPSLAPILGWGPNAMVDLNTLDVVTMSVAEKDLVDMFKSSTPLENKLSIMHYLVHHEGNLELAEELISWMCVNPGPTLGALRRMMQQYLLGATHTVTKRSLPASALALMTFLPVTMPHKLVEVKIGDICVAASQEKLWNVSVVVLGPRQRLSQFAEDMWTRLWVALNPANKTPVLKPEAVRAKLSASKHCYQPEALSRCSTPHSPTSAPFPTPLRRSSVTAADCLPFFEVDECTASKQEHVVAANLREVSVHLMKATNEGPWQNLSAIESGVHCVATRWVTAQLDASRAVCRAVCNLTQAKLTHQQRGFTFVDELEPPHALVLFKTLESYVLACELLAYPLPAGLASFFTYLGYRALPFCMFMQYVHRSVLELHYDVLRTIVTSKDDDPTTVNHKLRLIQIAGEGRARRALAAWQHEAALQLRARDHAATLLSGERTRGRARHRSARDAGGMTALPSGERLSSLDSFLDLLTAKASLNELDFNLIIEATLTSIQGGVEA